jgi:hypothetical protein
MLGLAQRLKHPVKSRCMKKVSSATTVPWQPILLQRDTLTIREGLACFAGIQWVQVLLDNLIIAQLKNSLMVHSRVYKSPMTIMAIMNVKLRSGAPTSLQSRWVCPTNKILAAQHALLTPWRQIPNSEM